MKRLSTLIGITIILILAAGLLGTAQAQSANSIYYPETGHLIWGKFLKTYQSVANPLLYFGYPITDDFVDPATNTRTQYFQKARFDLIRTAEGSRIQIAPLGQLMHEPGAPLADIPQEGTSCRPFESGYSVCYAFLQFYDQHEGAQQFGMPLSKVEIIDGRFMQSFEYARMEWWPDLPAGERVILSDLGSLYFDQVVADPALLRASPPPKSIGGSLDPQVHVFMKKALIGVGEKQTAYVIVQDRYLRAVEGAQVQVTVTYPDGTTEIYSLPESNAVGVSQFTFAISSLPIRSTVEVAASILVRNETAAGKARFRIWY